MPVFVDTNVLVYVRDRSEEAKQRRAGLWETGLGRLSDQVLQEYYVTLTTRLDPPRSIEDARDDVTALRAGCRYLLTADLQPGQVIDTLTVISPFAREPEEILPGL